jgi:hypothetical protein
MDFLYVIKHPFLTPVAFSAVSHETLSLENTMNKINPMEDTKLYIDGKRIWSATILLVEPYRETNQDFIAPEGTQARVVTTGRSFLTSMPPKDFADKFGFALLAIDNVAVNPYHLPRKNDGSYTFQVDEPGPNATTRDGATAYTRLSYLAGGETKFTNLTTDPDTVFDLVNPKQQAALSQSPKPAETAQSGPPREPTEPSGRKARSSPSRTPEGPGG